MGSCLRDP
jgi:hypothetical protein